MGKPTGFMDYKRQELALRPPQERIKDWEEIKTSSLPHKEELQKQAARCMDCSIPFCHSGVMLGKALSGCPLHNLMPEFNDFVYQGLDHFAYARLNKTNNFPEFTSHVCPAPCEGACSASLAGSAVSIRNLEQYIIETAFAEGYVKPNKPTHRSGQKVAVIGSGPAGLACADQLNKAGHSVTVYERADRAGGLLMYGIPNMKLDKHLVERRIKLLEEAGVTFELNSEIGHKISSETLLKQFDAIALCTGSTVPRDLTIPGRELQGIHFAKDYLHSVTKSFLDSSLQDKKAVSAKGKDVIVIGGGDTGNDCVGTAIRQGCESVLQLEMMPCPPAERAPGNDWPEWPRVLKTDYGQQEAIAKFGCDPRVYQTTVKEFYKNEAGQVCGALLEKLESQVVDGRRQMVPTGEEFTVDCDLVLIAAGFVGCESYVADAFGVDLTARGTVADDHYTTNVPGVFACGDMRRGQSLVVWALREGRDTAAVVDNSLMGYTNL